MHPYSFLDSSAKLIKTLRNSYNFSAFGTNFTITLIYYYIF